MTPHEHDFVKHTIEGNLTWEHDSSYALDSEEELDNWKNSLHELSKRCCQRISKSVHSMAYEVCNMPSYDGLGGVNIFLDEYEE